MDQDFSIIERLVSEFESGAQINASLDEINKNQELLQHWGYEHFFNWDFFFVASEDEIFVTDDDLLEYFDKEDLINVTDKEIPNWVENRIEELACADTIPTVHYTSVSNSIVVVWGASWGQAGIHFDDLSIEKSLEDLYEMLIESGFIFSSSETYQYPSDLLISKYKKFILDRLT